MLFDQSKPTYIDLVKKMGKIQNPKFDLVEVETSQDFVKLNQVLNYHRHTRKPFSVIIVKQSL